MLGDSYSWRALVKRDTGDREGQGADIRRAAGIFQEILRSSPDDEATLRELAAAYRRSYRLDDLLEAIRISRQLASSGNMIMPGITPPLLQKSAVMGHEITLLMNALTNAGWTYAEGYGQPGKAEPLLQESVELGRERMRQCPESNLTIYEFVAPAGNLGETRFLQGKTQLALRALKETVSGMEELKRRNFSQGSTDNPSLFTYFLGCLECESGDLAGGLDPGRLRDFR
jgi:tetratricopeptide (TPR) repeat protein